jgi:hypothetical protein
MYRFAVRVIISLATFAFGVFITLNFYFHIAKIKPQTNVIASQVSINQVSINSELKGVGYGYAFGQRSVSEEQKPQLVGKSKPVVCKDKTISLVWKPLINSQKDFWEWVNTTSKVYDCAQMFETEKIDLNKDGIKEIKIRGIFGNFCGATGNCSEWIFGRTRKSAKYKLLLKSGGEYFHVRKSSTNGYKDIYITTHDSASSSYHMIYKFSGKIYQENKCWFEDYSFEGKKYVMSCVEKTKQSEEQLRESEAKLKENSN